MKVSDLMSRNIITVSPDDYPKDAWEKLIKHNINHLIVIDGDEQLVGMISTWDFRPIINYLASAGDLKSTNLHNIQIYNVGKIKDLMTANPIGVKVDQEIHEVAEIMLEKHFHCLPVLEHDKLAGIITHRDLLRAIAEKKVV